MLLAFRQNRWLPRHGRVWYPSLRILQPPTLGDWEPVIEEVAVVLPQRVSLR